MDEVKQLSVNNEILLEIIPKGNKHLHLQLTKFICKRKYDKKN
nr:hypothetical protein [Mycoplasmopsis bovis]